MERHSSDKQQDGVSDGDVDNHDLPIGSLKIFVNGKMMEILSPDPSMTLLTYLRGLGLTGTKLGCGEGGCGACTVMISHFDHSKQEIKHYSCNACLAPLCSLNLCAITTVEGIGGIKQGLHPVQKRIAQLNGSQCGYCTPGIVMALYTQLRRNPNSTPHEIEENLDGNLCRCTGYRPILDAAKSLSKTQNTGQGVGGCCRGSNESCQCYEDSKNSSQEKIITNSTELIMSHEISCEQESSRNNLTEPIFPPKLMKLYHEPLQFTHKNMTWYQPLTLLSLHQLKSKFTNAKLVVGNTEVGIETKFKSMSYPVIINAAHIPPLKIMQIDYYQNRKGVSIGASVTLSSFREYIDILVNSCENYETRGLRAISHMLRWFASNHIRNVACIAGNIITASPISDLNPMLISCHAIVKLSSIAGERFVPINQFFISYRTVDIHPNEVMESIFIPFTSQLQFIVPLKQARRREDDISIVTSGIHFEMKIINSNEIFIHSCTAAFGGMAPMTKIATKTCTYLMDKPWSLAILNDAFIVLREEFDLPENVPGGQAEYRMSLACSFLFKAFFIITEEIKTYLESDYAQQYLETLHKKVEEVSQCLPQVSDRELSASSNFITAPKAESRGQQSYSIREGGLQKGWPYPHEINHQDTIRAPVGEPLIHKSAFAQVSGEAQYTDDTPLPIDSYHAALITSTRAHARLVRVDTSSVEGVEGFIAVFTAKDIPGGNHIGAVVKDEEVFVTEEVTHYGAVIGVLVATTHELAVSLAKRVVVTYEDLPAIISIEDAISNNSYFPGQHQLVVGDASAMEESCDVVVEGQIRIGGQEHFYLETNATVAIPKEGQLEVISSTQNPTKTQNFCAYVTALPASKVVAKCKRMGGGFGGKETRSVFIAVTAALAAHLLGHAVSINIERDLDMSITGQRHAFLVNYRAGATKNGELKFLDAMLYSNAGFSLDLSQPVIDRALFHADNCYKWPAINVRGKICRTNQPSHTAFRGFGGPQGLLISETVIDHISNVIGIPSYVIKAKNFYQEGDITHFGQRLEAFYIPSIFERAMMVSEFQERKSGVAAFNNSNRYRKRGIDIIPTKFGISFTAKFMNQGGALVHVYQDGTVLVAHGGTEMGQGLHTKVIQVVARCFNIPHEWVHISETATNTVANSSPTAASMSTDLYGMAALNACEQILDRLEPIRRNMPIESSWKDVVLSAFFQRVDLSAHGYYIVPSDRCGFDWDKSVEENMKIGQPFNYFTQGVAVSEVEIDCLTGDAIILRTDIFMDLGKSINPALDIGQIEGAFMQGYGWSTMEELIWGDKEHTWVRPGQLFTRGPGTYKIPSFNDVPLDFRVHLTDTNNDFAVHSSKAVGEPPFFLGACPYFAIKRAVSAARAEEGVLGYYPLQLPATSERIRMACIDKVTKLGSSESYQPKGSY